nr:hypothetical protein CFP56_24462 [Quercus suber]
MRIAANVRAGEPQTPGTSAPARDTAMQNGHHEPSQAAFKHRAGLHDEMKVLTDDYATRHNDITRLAWDVVQESTNTASHPPAESHDLPFQCSSPLLIGRYVKKRALGAADCGWGGASGALFVMRPETRTAPPPARLPLIEMRVRLGGGGRTTTTKQTISSSPSISLSPLSFLGKPFLWRRSRGPTWPRQQP